MGNSGGYYSQYMRFLWEAPTGSPIWTYRRLLRTNLLFVLTTNVDQQFFGYFPRNKSAPFRETLATANAVSLAGMIFGKTASW